MSKTIKVKDKLITIYANSKLNNSNKLPVVIYNSYDDDGKQLWEECMKMGCKSFVLVVIHNINWNDEMTPWQEKSLYIGDKEYGGKADEYISFLENEIPKIINDINIIPEYFCISGYSLAGLFAIYTMCKTNMFSRYVSCSGSFWYKGFIEYMQGNKLQAHPDKVYLSLGNREKNSKNALLATVEDKTIKLNEYFRKLGIETKLEFNEGGHFKEANLRMAKGIKWILD